jgi:uncharacterized protein (DUF736 family)
MAVIGVLRPSRAGGWEGRLRTLCLDAQIRLQPNDERDHPHAPAFRALVGRCHVGDAWERTRRGRPDRTMFQLVLDDPTFPAPIEAALLPDVDGQSAVLVWRRRSRRPPVSEDGLGAASGAASGAANEGPDAAEAWSTAWREGGQMEALVSVQDLADGQAHLAAHPAKTRS